jgi:hypothetical protein
MGLCSQWRKKAENTLELDLDLGDISFDWWDLAYWMDYLARHGDG